MSIVSFAVMALIATAHAEASPCLTAPSVMTRRDNPDSTVAEDENAARMQHYPTNDEINAGETGNPESVDFRYWNVGSSSSGDTWDLDALESENPDNPQAGRLASAPRAAVANCGGMLSAR